MDVFVYGTLTNPARAETVLGDATRAGGRNEPIEYEFAGEATLEGFHRVEGEYPTLVPGGSVDGRVLEVDERGLAALDAYEGVDQGLYVRAALPRVDHPGGELTEGLTVVDDHETTVTVESDSEGTQETDAENVVWAYIGDPNRLGIDGEGEDDAYWSGSEPFRERVRQHLTRETVIVRITE